MKVIIAGSRNISDINYIYIAIKESGFDVTEIISGTAQGVDRLGEEYAKEEHCRLIKFPADWNNITVPGAVVKNNSYGQYNAVAGHQRNIKMAEYADALVAVWDGKSTGTKHMITYMKKLFKPVFVYIP